MPEPVLIEYERDIISTAEGSTLSSMINDLSLLLQDGPEAEVFRRIYGSGLEADVSELRRKVREYDQILNGLSILVGGTTTKSGVPRVDEKIVPPAEIAGALTDAGVKKSNGAEWKDEDFTPPNVSSEAKTAYRKFYGHPIVFISEADLGQIERIAELAANIGVGLDRIDLAHLPPVDIPGNGSVTRFRIIAKYVAQLREELRAFEGASADVMRFLAQRPGGQNFSASAQADATKAALGQRIAAEVSTQSPLLAAGRLAFSAVQTAELAKVGFSPNEANYVPSWAVQRPDNYAVLRIVSGGGVRSPDPYNADTGYTVHYQTNRFLLESASENTVERAAFIDTFGPTYLYLFGTRAKIWSYAGTIMDSEGFTWLNEWRQAYVRYTGGTQTAKLKARCFLTYGNVVREGIIIGSSISQSVVEYGFARFAFQMFVIREHYLDGTALREQVTSLPTFLTERQSTQAVAEQYDVTVRDITPERPDFEGGDSKTLKKAREVENRLFRQKQDAIEKAIEAEAFPNGRLAQLSGTIITDLTDEEVRLASQRVVNRAARAQDFRPAPSRVSGSSGRAALSSVGSVKVPSGGVGGSF